MQADDEHLRLLSVFHYVFGGLTALFALFPVIHLALGLAMLLAPARFESKGDPPPALIGWIFVAIGAGVIAAGWTLAALMLAAGRNLARKTRYRFCFVVAAIECALMPLGTVLGVFTILVLMRDAVKASFAAPRGRPA